MSLSRFARAFFALSAVVAPFAVAQCDPAWATASPQPQLTGGVNASTLWDPDGAGPLPLQLVVAGSTLTGGMLPSSSRVGTWDGTQWLGLAPGPGTSGVVNALTVWNGQLVVGGDFTGGGLDRLALWNGTAWQPIPHTFTVPIVQLTVWNGTLLAVGQSTGPVIKSWNGAAWTILPAPPSLQTALALTVYQGQLCIAGRRTSPNAGVLDRWNGTSWASSIFASASATGSINCLAVRSSIAIGGIDVLYAGGNFTSIGGFSATSIASTTGGSFVWSHVGNNSSPTCQSLVARNVGTTGGYVVTATFETTPRHTGRYTSTTGAWTNIGVDAYRMIVYGGSYHGLVGATWNRHDGTAWTPLLGQGVQGEVRAIAPVGDDVIVGGTIQSVNGLPLNGIARWNGTAFEPLGTGVTGTSVDAVVRRTNGDIVAGGAFSVASGIAANNIARWDGSAWAAFGTGTNQPVLALCEMPNGDLIAGGQFTSAGGASCNRIARWNGSAWSSLNFGFNGDVRAVAVRNDGTLFAAGAFTAAGAVSCNRIARWDGFGWQPLGTGTNGDVHGIAFRPNGDVVAVGTFSNAGGVTVDRCAIWNGASWSSTNSGSGDATPARCVGVLPNGDVVAGRGFHQPGVTVDTGLARWNGTTWSGFGNGLVALNTVSPVDIRAIVQRADGALFVGGNFGFANGTLANGGVPARGLARLQPPCAATATNFGSGCSTGVGPLAITADTLPWIGSTLRTTTTGVPANALCLGLIGLTQLSIPLPSLLPEGQPGCSLLSSLDILLLAPNGPGNTATTSFALANDAALVGVPFVQQTIPFEFDAFGAIVAVRGSNALSLVIGVF